MNRRIPIGLVVASLAMAVGLASAASAAGTKTTAPPVKRLAEDLAERGAVSSLAYVYVAGKEHVATSGAARPQPNQRFRIGSVTKTFVATIALQLEQEGKLALDDSLERHLPGAVPRGAEISLRHLLSHRSGLANYTDLPYWPWLRTALDSPSTQPIDILRFAGSQPLGFEPGSRFSYSNTNYVALGLVVEKVESASLSDVLSRRILDPLALDDTELPTTRSVPGVEEDAVRAGEPDWLNPFAAWAAGSLVSTPRDLRLFFTALMSGRLATPTSLEAMKQGTGFAPGARMGLGLVAVDLPCTTVWGHTGGINDSSTLALATSGGKRVAVVWARRGPSFQPILNELFCVAKPAADLRTLAFLRTGRERGLYVVRADGVGQRRLSRIAPAAGERPVWSPDGRRIAFVGRLGGARDLFVIRADGKSLRRLTNTPAAESSPSWSPDGRRIAFASNGRILLSSTDGRPLHVLARRAVTPAWSPNGRWIALVSAGDVHVLRPDGTGRHNVTRSRATDSAPAWSPHGRELAFVSGRDVYVMNPDGVGRKKVAAGVAPAWSPDGRRIAIAGRSGVRVVNLDGWAQLLLARRGQAPSWSPNGQTIAFLDRGEIHVVDAGGGGTARNLTRSRADDGPFAWSPVGPGS